MDGQVGGMAAQGGGFHQGLIGPLLRQLAPAVRSEPIVTRPLQMMGSMAGEKSSRVGDLMLGANFGTEDGCICYGLQ